MIAAQAYVPRRARGHFAPIPQNVSAARALISGACRDWGLDGLRDSARLVASELASNAITHARTDFDVLASYTGRYLRIAVQDGDPAMPHPAGTAPAISAIVPRGAGRGLRVVAAAAAHWGATEIPGGKEVWALFPAPCLRQ